MVDTADCYCGWEVPGEMGGHSESLLGRHFADAGTRDATFLAAKATGLLTDLDGVWHPDGTANWGVARTKFVGAAPAVLRRSLADFVGTFASFVADGSTGTYGWSNVSTWRLAQIRAVADANLWPQPAALQQQHSYLRKRGPDFGVMSAYSGPDADARFAAVDSVATSTEATANQVVLAWMMAQDPPRVPPLIGARTFDQYLECIDALDVTLLADELSELDAAEALSRVGRLFMIMAATPSCERHIAQRTLPHLPQAGGRDGLDKSAIVAHHHERAAIARERLEQLLP
jgi:aryl-alcohol dehydrogenase-like predicted oxidoreductase